MAMYFLNSNKRSKYIYYYADSGTVSTTMFLRLCLYDYVCRTMFVQ